MLMDSNRHQRLVITGVDFSKKLITGYTELTIYPLSKLSAIYLNSRQTRIICTSVAGISVPFECNDPQIHLSKPGKKRALDGFALGHQQALNSSHLDLGGKGELTLKLPPDVQAHVQERRPVEVLIEFRLENPTGGVHFVVPPGKGSMLQRGAHMFSYQYGNSARLWFPCVDMLSEVCTWAIEVTVPADMTVVTCGQLQEQLLSDDERFKTFVYDLSVPTSACNIAVTVGAFEIVPDPKVQEITYFCPPGLSDLVRHSTSFLHEAFGFYEDFLSARFPYSCYKVVFVDESYSDLLSYASMSVISLYFLHTPRYIEQTVLARQILTLGLAQQYFGCFLTPKTWSELWLSTGAAGYLQLMFQRRLFGNSHYRCLLKQAVDHVCRMESQSGGLPALHPMRLSELVTADGSSVAAEHDTGGSSRGPVPSLHIHALHGAGSAWSSESLGRDRVVLQQALAQKALLIMHMLVQHSGQDCVMQAFNKLLALGLSASQQTIIAGSWNHLLLATDSFIRAVTLVSGKSLDTFLNQWVYQSGCAKFNAKFSYNRKRNAIELFLQHDSAKGGRKFVGPMTVSVQELDGPFQHVIQIDDTDKSYELPCHSKARRTKKKRIALVTGEEVDMDLSLVESDSPILWIRLDGDLAWLRTIHLDAPDYMWQLQVLHERDVVGQIEACKGIINFPTANSRKALTDTICHPRFFYRVRCCAAQSLASVITNSTDIPTPHSALAAPFRKLFGCNSQRDMVKLNDFSNLSEYYVQKEIPLALSTVRNAQGQCPREVVTFLSNLLKHNDNRLNKQSDVIMLVTLLEALVQTVTQCVTPPIVHPSGSASLSSLAADVAVVVSEITLRLNMEKLIPSYGLKLTCRCLSGLNTLVQLGHISGCLDIFRAHAEYGVLTDVRLVALQGVLNYVRAESSQAQLMWLLDLVENDPNPAIRMRVVRMLITNPPFTRHAESSLNNETVVDRLWHLLTVTSAMDMQLRCCLAELYGVVFGWLTPSCVPASGLGLYIDLKKKKSRTHMSEEALAGLTPTFSDKVDMMDTGMFTDVQKVSDGGDNVMRLKLKVGSAKPSAASSPTAVSTSQIDIGVAAPLKSPMNTHFVPKSPNIPSPSVSVSMATLSGASGFGADRQPVLSVAGSAPLIVKSHKRPHSDVSKKDGEKSHKKHKKEKHKHKHKHKHHKKSGESSKKSTSSSASLAAPPPGMSTL